MAGETYWRCKRCDAVFLGLPSRTHPHAHYEGKICAPTGPDSTEPVVVLPVAEYERLRGIEAMLRKPLMMSEMIGLTPEMYDAVMNYRRAVLGEET